MQYLTKNSVQPGTRIKHHDRFGKVNKIEQGSILIEYDDRAYEYISLDDIDRLICEGIIKIIGSENNSEIAQHKTKDVAILLVYLRALHNETYPCSIKTRANVIERFSYLYGKQFSEGYLYKKYRIWIDAGQDVRAIANTYFIQRRSKFSEIGRAHV